MLDLFGQIAVDDCAAIMDAVDEVANLRPVPYRKYDQIYMRASSMVEQVAFLGGLWAGKDVLLLGDGDWVGVLAAIMAKRGLMRSVPASVTVLDFDERILSGVREAEERLGLDAFPLRTRLYNIADAPDGDLLGRFQFFYANPPYGSRNEGLSCLLWLQRCAEICASECGGCMAMASADSARWAVGAIETVVSGAREMGFRATVSDRVLHTYHLKDNPALESTNIVFERDQLARTPGMGLPFTARQLRNLYGQTIAIPHYIRGEGRLAGDERFDWEYGELRAFD